MQWSVYNEATKRVQYSAAPTSTITAEMVMVSGFALLQENAEEITSYQANALNQYTMLSVDDITDFIPSYDAAGNQTRVKTSTGIWSISYDAENRPTDFTKVDSSGSTSIHCEYDHMGRRATKTISYNKKPYFDSNNYEIITEFNMDIVTEIPSDMPMTKLLAPQVT